jgi:DNA polymerase-3 subunit delta
MPEINYKQLKEHVAGRKNEPFAPVYLLYGEEFFCKTAAETLLKAMLPDYKKNINFEPVDGANDNIKQAIDKANTLSLVPGIKVVAIFDFSVFVSKQDEKLILEKAKKADDTNNVQKEAEPVVNDACDALQTAVEKGFPKKTHLVITAEVVDKRRGLFKAIKEKGFVVDCSVPKGFRKEDKDAQEAVLYERMCAILSETGKIIDKQTFAVIYDIIGFDIRTFSNSIEKLVTYVSDRQHITIEDVHRVLKRTKKDPLYEFTGAVAERQLEAAIFYLNSMLSGGDIDHPLQLLAAIINQFRKLIVIKDFAESSFGKTWQPGSPFHVFKSNTLDALIEYDSVLLDHMERWDHMLSDDTSEKEEKNTSGKKRNVRGGKNKKTTDLLIANNPHNAYPMYKMLQQSGRFTKKELVSFFFLFADTDKKLKTTGQNPKLVLEDMVINICLKGIS